MLNHLFFLPGLRTTGGAPLDHRPFFFLFLFFFNGSESFPGFDDMVLLFPLW